MSYHQLAKELAELHQEKVRLENVLSEMEKWLDDNEFSEDRDDTLFQSKEEEYDHLNDELNSIYYKIDNIESEMEEENSRYSDEDMD